MKKIAYSAPAKVILSGEHSVVYGKPAIACAIDRRLTVSVLETKTKEKINKNIRLFSTIALDYLKKKNIQHKERDYTYEIASRIPIGRGLGSSAAYSSASIAAFLTFFSDREYDQEIVNNLAYSAEKKFHERPSGVDNTVASCGGLIYFRKEFEFLKGIYKLSYKIPRNIEEHLYLIDTGKPDESTREMVALVGEKYNKHPDKMRHILNDMETITKRLVVSIMKNDPAMFREGLSENEALLEQLGVVSEKTRNIIVEMSAYGDGKITGAGGLKNNSGFILFYANEPKALRKYGKKNSLYIFPFRQSHTGVQKI